jgi:hypothetical protein
MESQALSPPETCPHTAFDSYVRLCATIANKKAATFLVNFQTAAFHLRFLLDVSTLAFISAFLFLNPMEQGHYDIPENIEQLGEKLGWYFLCISSSGMSY